MVDRCVDTVVEDDLHVGHRLVEHRDIDELVRRTGTVDIDLQGVALEPDVVAGIVRRRAAVVAEERGEIDGRCGWSWSAIKATSLSWITEKKIRLLVQMGLSKEPELPDVPSVMDRATGDRDRQMLDLLLARQVAAWPFMAPPGLPEDRKAALRQAFDDTMRDPGFIAENG